MPKILITGSSGMLGKDLVEVFSRSGSNEIFGFDRVPLSDIPSGRQIIGDLTNDALVKMALSQIKPDIIIHSAAIVNVDVCEYDHAKANALHIEATRLLASFRPDRMRFVYISTDAVFDGTRGNYLESDAPNPVNYYGLSKHRGEVAAYEANPRALILRTNLFGFHVPAGASLAEWAIESLNNKRKVTGFTDVIFNPLYTKQLAEVVALLISDCDTSKIYNVASDEVVSKCEFIRKLARVFGLPLALIAEASVDDFPFKTPRPKNTSLNTNNLRDLLGSVPSIDEGIRMFKGDYCKSFPESCLV